MIRIEGLRKRFGAVTVVDGIDLAIPAGQRVALVGSNGAGKTTLIRCLLGEYTHEGKVTIGGRSPRTSRAEVLARIAFVPQLPPPLRMPVGELIRYVASVTAADAVHVEQIGARLGLEVEPLRTRAFVKLSGGQKQKLLVALALARPADVFILDEPAANLDPAARAALFELMAERRDAAMIISSHRLDEIAGLVNRVIEIDRGKVVLDDRVVESLDIDRRLACRIELARPEPAFAKVAQEWGFAGSGDGTIWSGEVPAPDRLRFLGFLARYSALIVAIKLEENARVPLPS